MIKVTISKTQNLHMFTKQGDLSFVEKYALNPLIHLNLYLDLFLLISLLKHSENYEGWKSCQKCVEFYERHLCLKNSHK